jgi:hypothetical protein
MTKKINTELLNSLLEFNFLFQNSIKSEKINSRFYIKKYSTKHNIEKLPLAVLEPIELIKALQQTIRLLQFLKDEKSPMLHLEFNQKSLYYWFKFLFEKSSKQLSSSFYPMRHKNTAYIKSNNKTNLLFAFGMPATSPKMKRFLIENVFLVNHFTNINDNNDDYGTYKFHSSVNDWKKLIFFYILIKKNYTKN